MDKGRKPKPTALRLLEGNREHKKIKNHPKPENKKIEPPEWLMEGAKEEWERVSPQLYSLGLLTDLDVATLEAYCISYAKWKEAEKKADVGIIKSPSGYLMQNPYIGIANRYCDRMRKLISELGMSPVSREKIEVKTPIDRPSRMQELINGK